MKDMVARKEVNVKYIATEEMVADPFTKPIFKENYFRHVKSLGLHRLYEYVLCRTLMTTLCNIIIIIPKILVTHT